MKKLVNLILIVLVIPIIMAFNINEEIEATYMGISENDEYKFIDDDGDEYLFREIDSDVEIDLNDKEYIGEKFIVEYIHVEDPIYDEEGEETGETEKYLRITKLIEK